MILPHVQTSKVFVKLFWNGSVPKVSTLKEETKRRMGMVRLAQIVQHLSSEHLGENMGKPWGKNGKLKKKHMEHLRKTHTLMLAVAISVTIEKLSRTSVAQFKGD